MAAPLGSYRDDSAFLDWKARRQAGLPPFRAWWKVCSPRRMGWKDAWQGLPAGVWLAWPTAWAVGWAWRGAAQWRAVSVGWKAFPLAWKVVGWARRHQAVVPGRLGGEPPAWKRWGKKA